jgi:hypothetical protein
LSYAAIILKTLFLLSASIQAIKPSRLAVGMRYSVELRSQIQFQAFFLNWTAKIEKYFIPPKPFCIFAANRL